MIRKKETQGFPDYAWRWQSEQWLAEVARHRDGCVCASCYDFRNLIVEVRDGVQLSRADLQRLEMQREADTWYAAEVARMAERAPA